MCIRTRMRSASVFVLASFHEGFPNVLLEAMSNGCAIVASNCDFGPGEIIEHGVNGLLFATGSVLDCAQKIRSLLMDAQLREKLGNNAKATAQRYAAIPIFEQWERIINDVKEQIKES